MKNTLLCLCLLTSFLSFGQGPIYTGNSNDVIIHKGVTGSQGGIVIPVVDTNLASTIVNGTTVIGTNNIMYTWDGTYWISTSGSSGGGVTSFKGRTGIVTPQTGDYTFSQISSTPTTLGGYGITDGVKTIAVNNSNGFSATSSGGSTPILTISATPSGILKSNGSTMSAATSGTDYENPLTFNSPLSRSVNTISLGAINSIGTINTYNSISTTGTGLSPIYAETDLTSQNGPQPIVTSYSVPGGAAGTFRIGSYVNISTILTDILNLQVTWTDENSNSRTQIMRSVAAASNNIATTGFYCFSPIDIRVKAGTTITIATVLQAGGGTIIYDVGGSIMQIK